MTSDGTGGTGPAGASRREAGKGPSQAAGGNPGTREHRRGRDETPEERADRRWGDLLQELRVAQTGVQILFGFLLTVVFQPGFGDLSDADRRIYVITVMLGAATTGVLIGPVSFHRLLTGKRLKPQTVVWASRLTLLGLALLLCTMASALLLVLRVVVRDAVAVWLVAAMVLWFVMCWFVLPVWARHNVLTGRADR
ncbi:DUF6328 family protein [Streptomyces pactum]|uniref:DUF6328 family protein n=1 Tax=Streptomyces pactum TaxID=68249 RepID=UPI0027DBC248|nr:DUF6328 family protein [Streptomyces pactum]